MSEELHPHATRPKTRPPILKAPDDAIEVARGLSKVFGREAARRDRERLLPWAELDAFSQSGLWALNVPRAYGGPELSYRTIVEVFAIIAEGDASIAQIAQNHVSLLDIVRLDPDEDRRRKLFEFALAGLRLGNAQAEKGGRTIRDIETRIVTRDDHFEVTGRKYYATGALFSHIVPVSAIDEENRRVLAFLDRDAAGLAIQDDWDGFGQRTTGSGTVVLDRVRVGRERVVPAYLAYEQPTVHGPIAQILHAAIDLGLARRTISEALAFVRDRARAWCDSGKDRASEDPFVLRDVADLNVRLHAAEAVLYRAAKIIDKGLRQEGLEASASASIAVAQAKVLTTEIAVLAADKLFELGGSRSTPRDLNLDRFWRDARVHTLHDPVRWKFHAIGNFVVNGVAPPRHSWI